jgi:hypothetical protein
VQEEESIKLLKGVAEAIEHCTQTITSAAKVTEFGLGTADTKSTYIDLATVLPIPTL